MSTKEIGSGWSPAYSFRSIFLQIQNFLADHDFPECHIPTETTINWLREKMDKYKRDYVTEDGKKVTHTSKTPYPVLGEVKLNIPTELNSNTKTISSEEINESQKLLRLNILMERVTCFLNRNNPLNDKGVALGYPFLMSFDFKKRIEPNPIPEILSYEGYMSEIMANPNKLDDFFNVKFKTANLNAYNYWCPIYLNEEHYQENKGIILNAISVMRYGPEGKKEYDFKPALILEVLPAILNKMVVFILKGTTHMSIAAIEAYCHYLMLLNRLIKDFPEVQKMIDTKAELLISPNLKESDLNKTNIPDIGNFIVWLCFSKLNLTNNKDILRRLMKEYLARQIYWRFNSPETREKDQKDYVDILMKDSNIQYLNFSAFPQPEGFTQNDKYLRKKEEELRRKEEHQFRKIEERLLDKAENFEEKLKVKFEKYFWTYYDIEDIDDFDFSSELFDSPPEAVKSSFELRSEWTKCKELYSKVKNLESCDINVRKMTIKLIEQNQFNDYDTFDVNSLEPLHKKIPTDTLKKNIEFHLRFNKIPLFDACTQETKDKILNKMFKQGIHVILFTFKAALKFATKDSIKKLSENYCLVDENEAEEFVKLMRKTNSKMKSYRDLVNELEIPDFYNKNFSEFDGFLQSVILSSDQLYTNYPIQNCVRNFYEQKFMGKIDAKVSIKKKDFIIKKGSKSTKENSENNDDNDEELFVNTKSSNKGLCKIEIKPSKEVKQMKDAKTSKEMKETKDSEGEFRVFHRNKVNKVYQKAEVKKQEPIIVYKTIPGLPGYKKQVSVIEPKVTEHYNPRSNPRSFNLGSSGRGSGRGSGNSRGGRGSYGRGRGY